ncbi:MAG: hypothetical protein M1826_001998 [Phylliscum demangeonii]|nr:MAG: hypothetical protein M1826_001998 [Phylliscum demangeonii]
MSHAASSLPGDPSAAPYTHGLAGVNVTMNDIFVRTLWISIGALGVIVLVTRLAQIYNAHTRQMFALSASAQQQSYWTHNRSSLWPAIKKHVLYAPLGKKRHNREIQLSSAINVGTLPSRFHTALLLSYLLSNVAYCVALNYSGHTKAQVLAQLRGRSGVLAVANMIPLFIMAGRNNPLIWMLKVSFDTYNLLHRWIGRMVVLEALVHTCAWGANEIAAHGPTAIADELRARVFTQYGLVGTLAMTLILLHSPSPVRHAFYETFLTVHQLLALAAVIGVYFHLSIDHLPQLIVLRTVVAIWALDRLARFGRIIYRCWSWTDGFSTISVEALPGDASRVTIQLRRPWHFTPGSHVYIYLPTISLHQSHPFSVAWCDEQRIAADDDEKLPMHQTDLDRKAAERRTMTVSMVIHKRSGMTATLFDRAAAAPDGRLTLRGAVEGPYGGMDSLQSYGTVVLFAGGIGITHQVSHVRDLMARWAEGSVATKKIILVWAVRTTENLEWVRPWMDEILQTPGRRDVLKILLFVTKPKSPREVISPSATVQMFPGRPQPQLIIDQEIEERVGAMAVTVCGPGSLADSVRDAARKRVDIASLDFIEESFTW